MASTSSFIFFHFILMFFLLFIFRSTRVVWWDTHEINFVAPFQKSVVPLLPLFNHEREISSSTGQCRRVYNYRLSLLSEVTRLLLFSFPNVELLYITYGLFTCQKARSSSRSRKKKNGGTFKPIELSWHTPSALRALVFHVLPRHVAMTATPILSECRCVVLPVRIDSHKHLLKLWSL